MRQRTLHAAVPFKLLDMLALIARTRAHVFFRAAATSVADAPAKVPLFKKYSNADANLANVGVRWTETEIQDLVSRIGANEPLETVALKHKRTVKSIKARLASLASAAITADPASQAKVLAKYRITVQDIEELNQQNAARKVKPAKSTTPAPASSASKAAPSAAAAGTASTPPLPAMVGKPWTSEHNEELMKQAMARKSIADISTLLLRTPRSVEMRIAQLSLDKGMTKVRATGTNVHSTQRASHRSRAARAAECSHVTRSQADVVQQYGVSAESVDHVISQREAKAAKAQAKPSA